MSTSKPSYLVPIFLVAVGCGLPTQKAIPPNAPKLKTFTRDEVQTRVASMLAAENLGPDIQNTLRARLNDMFDNPELKPKFESLGINAVAVYEGGSGGMMFKQGNGNGVVSFAGGSQDQAFHVSGYSMGANIGGERVFGAAVVIGLDHEEKFVDRYQVVSTGATAGAASLKQGTATPERGTHRIHFAGTGMGLSADAGTGVATIVMAEPDGS